MTKILLVEDDKSLREIYGVRLLAEGYDIVSAGDGEEALAMAIKEKPQLIVSDVMMPKISGFDMLDILRSTTETKDIKVIMMTALSSEDQRARGQALGADRYLVKSQVGIEDVVRTVHDVLGDAPVTMPSAAQTFNTPVPTTTPSATPRPAPTIPSRPDIAQAAPTPAPVPEPVAPQPVTQPQTPPLPKPAYAPAGLPQPTAPFSTARPANLGDRIIHPLSAPEGQEAKPDISSLMDQELSQHAETQAPSAPVTSPVPEPPVQQPQVAATQPPEPQAVPTAPQPPSPQQDTTTPQPSAPVAPPPSNPVPDIEFEETPRPPAPPPPPPNPLGTSDGQSPIA